MSITTHMQTGFQRYSHPTYDELASACRHIATFIHHNTSGINKVDTIVGISRGGLMPALELSHLLNITMSTIHYSSKQGAGDDRNHLNELPALKGKSILLVDDIVDSGNTLKEIHEEYDKRGHNVFSAAIYFKDHKEDTIYVPDVWAIKISQNFGWITHPWENPLNRVTGVS